jgi:NDP-sugar pyrophosphorylase family protein
MVDHSCAVGYPISQLLAISLEQTVRCEQSNLDCITPLENSSWPSWNWIRNESSDFGWRSRDFRLRPLLRDRPKPTAPIKGKPFLEYQIEQLRANGLSDLVLCVGHLAHHIQDYFGDGRDWGVQIAYAVETELLDTAGAIKSAQGFIEDTFLVLNGDSYLEADFLRLIESHRDRQSADPRTIGTVAIVGVDEAASYGRIGLNGKARLLSFEEKVETGLAGLTAAFTSWSRPFLI